MGVVVWLGIWYWRGLVKADAFVRILGAGVGEDHLIAGLETADDFDRVDRTAAKFHRRAGRFGRSGDEFENPDGVILLAEGRAADVNDVVETLELDRAVNAEIRARAFRQFAVESDIDSDRSLLDRGIDPDDVACDNAVAGVDRWPAD